jgi:hypothetical protein
MSPSQSERAAAATEPDRQGVALKKETAEMAVFPFPFVSQV